MYNLQTKDRKTKKKDDLLKLSKTFKELSRFLYTGIKYRSGYLPKYVHVNIDGKNSCSLDEL